MPSTDSDCLVEPRATPTMLTPCGFSTFQWAPSSKYLFECLRWVLEKNVAKAVLWHQGESDCGELFSQTMSYLNMKEMIVEAKKIQNIPWVIAINSDPGVHPGCPVTKAQKRIIAEGLAHEGPNTDLNRKGRPGKVDSEYYGEALKEHGMSWVPVIKKHFYKKSEHRKVLREWSAGRN